jgi:phosphonate C-P lyase system protein PhnG
MQVGKTLKGETLAVLADANPAETERLLSLLEIGGIDLADEPAPALVMMDARDCFGTAFHLGEVLVTRAVVHRDGRVGFGLIIGDEPAKALLLACLDLLDEFEQAAVRERLAPHLAALARRVESARGLAAGMSAATKVEFQSMTEG